MSLCFFDCYPKKNSTYLLICPKKNLHQQSSHVVVFPAIISSARGASKVRGGKKKRTHHHTYRENHGIRIINIFYLDSSHHSYLGRTCLHLTFEKSHGNEGEGHCCGWRIKASCWFRCQLVCEQAFPNTSHRASSEKRRKYPSKSYVIFDTRYS